MTCSVFRCCGESARRDCRNSRQSESTSGGSGERKEGPGDCLSKFVLFRVMDATWQARAQSDQNLMQMVTELIVEVSAITICMLILRSIDCAVLNRMGPRGLLDGETRAVQQFW